MTALRPARARTATATASLALTALLLGGCSASPAGSADPAAAEGSSTAHETGTSAPVRLVDGWAKAGETGGMTGVFGTLENRGDDDLAIVAVTSEAAASAELHEVTSAGVMREIPGEVIVPAGGSIEFAPGADHVMLMDLTRALLAGDEVPLTLRFDDGSQLDLSVLVKDYSGANENYGGEDHTGHGGEGGTGSEPSSNGHGGH